MRTFILFLAMISGFVLHAEDTPQNKDGTRQAERTTNQNPTDGSLDRKLAPTEYEARVRAAGRTPSATTDTAAQRDAEMRERDAKQAEVMAAREARRPEQTPKAANEQVQRDYQQQKTFDQRENAATTDEQKRKAVEARQGR